MRRVVGVAVIIVVLALAAGVALPTRAQAGAAADPERDKLVELLKLQLLLSRGEHGQFHDVLEKLVQKYPNDPDVKALSDEYHELLHKRIQVQEETVDILMKKYLSDVRGGN